MRADERGVVSLEVVALVPLVVLVTSMVLQGAAVAWTAVATTTAVRQAARADSLGFDPDRAAAAALPAGANVVAIDRIGSGHIRLSVVVPRVSPLPTLTVTREADLP